ncbi:MAG: hypothetical protein J0M12_12315 [Deltaproteobacteria bacterium]|nr:hypothetical protein [Deltaproteobacteria bacterium]
MKNNLVLSIFTILAFTLLANQFAQAQSVAVKGSIKNGKGYTVALLSKDGSSKTKAITSNKGAFSIGGVKLSKLKNSSLQLIGPDGRFYGPVVLGKKGRKASITFSGKNPSSGKSLELGKIALKSGFAIASSSLSSSVYAAPKVSASSSGQPTGAGNSGFVSAGTSSFGIGARSVGTLDTASPGEDSDRDGIVNSIDADDNGNGILDSADPASAGSDAPYVGINFDFRKTLNANVRSGLSAEAIDAVVSGENVFASTFFISLPLDSTVDGGYLVCGDALTYCRKDSPLGYSSGVSESSNAYRGPMSSLLNSSGYPILERISVGGNPAIVLSIQPRVGRDVFRAGDMYRVVLTSGGTDVSSRTFSLPPYFISVPAIKEYTANSATTVVDYDSVSPSSGSIPGVSSGDPIVLGSDGLLSLSFWRPQREPVGTEEGYQDFGALNYGVIISNAQATCAGYYTAASSDLVEDSTALGNGDSPLAQNGANLTPLVDQTSDRPASASNLLSFTVDLKSCLARSGGSPGTYSVTLSAAGTDLTGGRNSANQVIYVTIP